MRILLLIVFLLLLPQTAHSWDVRVVQNEPIMTSKDTVGGTMISISTKNKDCAHPILSVANYLHEKYEESKEAEGRYNFPSALRFSDGQVAALPPQSPKVMRSKPTGNGILVYQHVPTDKLYHALMNTETLEYKDPIFKEDTWSKHDNKDFVPQFNKFMGLCFEMYGLKDLPHDHEEDGKS